MNRNVPTPEQIAAAVALGKWAVFWVDSIDYHGQQCRTLISSNSLTDRLGFADMSAPIHQTCEIRTTDGQRII